LRVDAAALGNEIDYVIDDCLLEVTVFAGRLAVKVRA
jgi:hypothetical protein